MTNVVVKDADTVAVHGVLDDDIYSLEIDVTIQLSELKILSIDGKWHRYTTPDCPRAIPLLQEVIGFRIGDEGFSQAVHKTIGRKACRHYANLLIECCDSAKEAALIHKWRDARKRHPDLLFADFRWVITWDKSTKALLEEGWVSPGYGLRERATILVLKDFLEGTAELHFSVLACR